MSLSETEKIHRLALNHFPQIGPLRARLLLESLGSAEAAWQASAVQLQALPRFSAALVEKFMAFRRNTQPEALYQQVADQGIQLCFLGDAGYPSWLAEIYDPPLLLYWRGRPELWPALARSVAMVGTRSPSAYGQRVALGFAEALASAGVCIVSGMALGIDALAHQGALKAGGMTVAVLGSGLDNPSPPSHWSLYQRLCREGLVLSELPPDHPPRSWTFPMRNRIVSGLARGVIVVEAGLKSGTLITVDAAHEQGREVFAVPGGIDAPQSQGTNALIQQGAHLLRHPDEVLHALGWVVQATKKSSDFEPNDLTNDEARVYVLLGEHPIHVDALADKIALSPQTILGVLTVLEMKGIVEQLPGKHYKKTFRL